MTYHRPQHLLFAIVALPLVASQPLYQQYNLRPRNVQSNSSLIHHRLLQVVQDYEFSFDITSTECVSPLIEWSMSHIREMGYSIYKELYDSKILEMPYVYKHYIDKNEDQESFGYDGSQTEELIRRHKDTMAFWTEADVDDSIVTEGILLLSMHGQDLMDNDKLVPTIIHMFDFDNEKDILDFAQKVQDYVLDLPDGFHNPLLTMNAVATRGGEGSRKSGKTIPSLIIGDGVLQFVNDSNLSGSGPDFVHAHEFGHHLQYEMDLVHNVPPGYENDIRRKELMADAISAYFLAHDKGGNFEPHQISEFSMTAFATGDCNTGQDDHHGTPKQRYCASVWGASRAILAPDGSSLIDPETFVELFNADYGKIFELDDATCTLILEEPDGMSYANVPDSSNFDPSSVEANYLEPFSTEEDYETADGSSMTESGGYTGDYDAQIEPPHETSYKHGLPGQQATHELPPGGHIRPDSTVDQAANDQGHGPLVLVSGRPSDTKLHEQNVDHSKYRCNLPWVYCGDEISSAGGNNVAFASAAVALVAFVLL